MRSSEVPDTGGMAKRVQMIMVGICSNLDYLVTFLSKRGGTECILKSRAEILASLIWLPDLLDWPICFGFLEIQNWG